jgi:mannose-6-phosphate isomerase-like protein (cupin superfamily)
VDYILLNRGDLPHDANTYSFVGAQHEAADISFIWVDMLPGDTVRLHKHPYKEVFIIQEGRSTFTVGSITLEAQAGQIIIVDANVPHKFINSGEGRLQQIDIHVSDRFITVWLED